MYWTKDKDKLLADNFPFLSWDKLLKLFPGKSVDSLRKRASRLNIKRNIPIEDLFHQKIEKLGECWIWKGHIKDNGYGQFQVKDKHVYAHRFAYELYHTNIADGLVVDHLCKNRACVNPDHLRLVNKKDNVLINSDSLSAINMSKEFCKNGHKFTTKNTYIDDAGARHCKKCMVLRDRRRYSDRYGDNNNWKTRKDTHDYFDDDLISQFLRNHCTGINNLGRQYLARIVSDYDNPVVLDCGCGTCVNWEVLKFFRIDCEYIGFDRTIKLLDHARKLYGDEITLIEGYAQELTEYVDRSDIDIIIIRHLLEHIPNGNYDEIIKQACQLANKEVILVFFLDLLNHDRDIIEKRGPDERGCYYYWNQYSRAKLYQYFNDLGLKEISEVSIATPGAAHADHIIRIKLP